MNKQIDVAALTRLTPGEIRLILEKISDGFGYSDDPIIGPLQAKLSIWLGLAELRAGGVDLS